MIPYCLLWVFGRRGMLRLLKGVRDWFLTWSFIPQNFFWVNNFFKCLYFASLSDLLDSCTFHASFWLTFCCVRSTLSMYVGSFYSFILFSMKYYYLSKKEKKIIMSGEVWMTGPSCLMWYIWKKRNPLTFEGKEFPLPHLKFLFLKTLYEWTYNSYTLSMTTFMGFLDDLPFRCSGFYFLFFIF